MVALRSTRKGFMGLFSGKPEKPSARGNAVAFKAGEKSFKKNGSTPSLQHAVLMSFQHDAKHK